jgi:hypothetical protein
MMENKASEKRDIRQQETGHRWGIVKIYISE